MTTRPHYLSKTATGWLIQAPAKLNLYLEVLGKRADGFHDLETLITPIGLFDTLHLAPLGEEADCTADGVSLEIHSSASPELDVFDDAEPLPCDERNLVVKALQQLRAAIGSRLGTKLPAVRATLWKRIPSRAGLGGGSSDAAAALIAGQKLWDYQLPREQLHEIAAGLGSDVPVFLVCGPAVCRGRGEQVEPIALPAGLPCVLLQPPVGLGAGQVFAQLPPGLESKRPAEPHDQLPSLLAALRNRNFQEISQHAFNRLEEPAERITNWITKLRSVFDQLPVACHHMSGSGAVYYGLCQNWRLARRVAATLRQQQLGWVGLAGTC